jgi:hypothetical protein
MDLLLKSTVGSTSAGSSTPALRVQNLNEEWLLSLDSLKENAKQKAKNTH